MGAGGAWCDSWQRRSRAAFDLVDGSMLAQSEAAEHFIGLGRAFPEVDGGFTNSAYSRGKGARLNQPKWAAKDLQLINQT
jgi:hypothetical protein